MKARSTRLAHWLALSLTALPSLALANGRMPGANDVVFDPRDPAHLLLRATFGVMQSFDAGESWQWICEQAVGTSGVIADPPVALLGDGRLVLLPPSAGALLSNDRGCSWFAAPEPLSGQRGVDLTLDPSDPAHLLVLTSTLVGVDTAGFGSYRNLLIETRDGGASWQLVSRLPDDFEAETVEVAASAPARVYVSGTASSNPRLGIVQRSDDGGVSWVQSSWELPAGTGSLLISAIHPQLPDRLWFRVPARGDTLGVLPGRLYVSDDQGQSVRMVASTRYGMFGFALSPDGSTLAYGGPSDGMYVGPADGSAAFTKVSSVGVRCLRWQSSGALYTCATEPADSFSLGRTLDRGASIAPLYALAETCPQACAEGSSAAVCQEAWQGTRPFIRATGAMCAVPWAAPALDAGSASSDAGSDPSDAGSSVLDAALDGSADGRPEAGSSAPTSAADGCACDSAAPSSSGGRALSMLLTLTTALLFRRRTGGSP